LKKTPYGFEKNQALFLTNQALSSKSRRLWSETRCFFSENQALFSHPSQRAVELYRKYLKLESI
jgi:hypothetical protein